MVLLSLVLAATPLCASERFWLSDEGKSITDQKSGLVWARCLLGQAYSAKKDRCTGRPLALNWQSAVQAVKALEYAGHHDWRLPSRQEFQAIVHCSSGQPVKLGMRRPYTPCQGEFRRPTLKPIFGPMPTWGYWANARHSGYEESAWYLYLHNGFVGHFNEYEQFHVWPVRSATQKESRYNPSKE